MKNTKIEWCDHTVNFWWGCTEVSEACQNCYARAIARRFKVDCWGDDKLRHFRFEKAIEEVRKLNASAKRRHVVEMVFVNSMSDFFDGNVSDGIRLSLWRLFKECENLCFMILTKRAQTFRNHFRTYEGNIPQNVHFGFTAENQERFDERMSALVGLDVKVFLSCEPLLGAIDISRYAEKIDWVIAGGENAPRLKCRNFDSRHANNLLRQAQEHNIPYFFKSTGKRHNFYDLKCKSVSEPMATREYPAWHSKGGEII